VYFKILAPVKGRNALNDADTHRVLNDYFHCKANLPLDFLLPLISNLCIVLGQAGAGL